MVSDAPTDLKQFGLADAPITVEFKAEGGASGSVKLGSKNPTQGEIYAQKGGENYDQDGRDGPSHAARAQHKHHPTFDNRV